MSYIGRRDDIVVLSSGVKIDALALERTYDMHDGIVRTAVISKVDHSAPVLLIQPVLPNGRYMTYAIAYALIGHVLRHNETLSFDKRIQTENIIFVDELPVTTKLTINRKKIKKIWTESNGIWPGKLLIHSKGGRLRQNATDFPNIAEDETCRRIKILLQDVFDIPQDIMRRGQIDLVDLALSSSLAIATLARALEDRFGVQIRAHQIYSLRSVDDLCRLVEYERGDMIRPSSSIQSDSGKTMLSHGQYPGDLLVITGMSCCLPGGVRSTADFWSALLNPKLYHSHVSMSTPPSRWSSLFDVDCEMPPVMWLDDDAFSAKKSLIDSFRLSPRDIEDMSPNARLALQLSYQAIEDAAIAPKSLGGKSWGVYTSVNDSGWREREASKRNVHGKIHRFFPLSTVILTLIGLELSQALIGSADSTISGRLSYSLDLTGPAIEIKAACSSSAVAIHQGMLYTTLA